MGIGTYYFNLKATPNTISSALNSTPNYTLQRNYTGTIYFEPFLFRKQLIESSLVLETGYTHAYKATFLAIDQSLLKSEIGYYIPVGIGLSVNFKMPKIAHIEAFRWIGLNWMGGYRTSIYHYNNNSNYNAFYQSISGALFLDQIYTDYKKHRQQKHLEKLK
jgi:hypothetical protein